MIDDAPSLPMPTAVRFAHAILHRRPTRHELAQAEAGQYGITIYNTQERELVVIAHEELRLFRTF